MLENETEKVVQPGLIMRIKRPSHDMGSNPVLLLLHGWTGNEDVMWIFTQRLPLDYWILAPRGPVSTPEGGFGWVRAEPGSKPPLEDFKQSANETLEKISGWAVDIGVDFNRFSVMGFSQGAIMSYALSFLFPGRVLSVAALAGYFPLGWLDKQGKSRVAGKPFYIAHGKQDQTVPIELARHSVQALQHAGADVTYCESDAGHKLSMACLHGLEDFLINVLSPGK